MLMSSPIHIIIVDDHPITIKGIRETLRYSDEIEIIGEAAGGEELFALLNTNLVPHIILLDIQLPGADGIQVMRKVRKQFRNIKVILFSLNNDVTYIARCMNEGANAYIAKTSDTSQIRHAIIEVHKHGFFISEEVARLSLKLKRSETEERKPLSAREEEMLLLICQGLLNKEIAVKMNIRLSTVDYHKKNIMLKTCCKNDAQLGLYARETGLFPSTETQFTF
jgi:DNA-binding NarL/FixJ family response regulator